MIRLLLRVLLLHTFLLSASHALGIHDPRLSSDRSLQSTRLSARDDADDDGTGVTCVLGDQGMALLTLAKLSAD